jgi:hypothetical protein
LFKLLVEVLRVRRETFEPLIMCAFGTAPRCPFDNERQETDEDDYENGDRDHKRSRQRIRGVVGCGRVGKIIEAERKEYAPRDERRHDGEHPGKALQAAPPASTAPSIGRWCTATALRHRHRDWPLSSAGGFLFFVVICKELPPLRLWDRGGFELRLKCVLEFLVPSADEHAILMDVVAAKRPVLINRLAQRHVETLAFAAKV